MNETGTIGKAHRTIFRRATYHRSVFNMACAGACECQRTSFACRPGFDIFFLKIISKACPVVINSNSLKMSVWFAVNLKKLFAKMILLKIHIF